MYLVTAAWLRAFDSLNLNISNTKKQILLSLHEYRKLTRQDITAILARDETTISHNLSDLQALGYVVCTPCKSRNTYELTKQGYKTMLILTAEARKNLATLCKITPTLEGVRLAETQLPTNNKTC